MADVTIRAKWDGKSVEDGVKRTTSHVNTLGSSLKVAVGALGIGFGVYQGWAQVQKTFHGVVEEATIFERLQNTINRRGGATAETMRALNSEVNRLATSGSVLEDSQIANTLERLVETSGDAAGSVKNLGLAIDISVAKHIELERAAKIVGFVMKGEIDQASRLAPEIKELSRDFSDLKGTTELAAAGLRTLASVTGAAEGERDTAAGNIARLNRGVSELSENLFKMASGGTGFLDFIGKVGDHANRIADAIERGSNRGGVIGGLLGGAVGSAVEAYIRGTAPGIPIPGGAFRGAGARQGIVGPLDPSWWTRDQGPMPLAPVDSLGGGTTGDGGSRLPTLLMAEERARDRARMRLEPLGSAGRVRGGIGLLPMPAGRREQDDAPAMLLKKWKEEQEELRNAIASTIEGGILAGAEGGFQGLLAYMRDQVIRQIASMLAQTIANAIVPGGGAGLGALLGLAGGGGDPGASNFANIVSGVGVKSSNEVRLGGVASARLRSQELRMARIG